MEKPELRHWQHFDFCFVNFGRVFCIFLLKVIIVFKNIACALSLSNVAIIQSLFILTLSRWQLFPGGQEPFMIQNTYWQPLLL